jgi:peptidoglycan/xylan/chitin deacetylase (PgdA/CDA1 family)
LALALVGCGAGAHSAATRARRPAAAPTTATQPVRSARRPTPAPAQAHVAAALARLAARGMPVYCGGRAKPWVAFTFDDGPGVYTQLAVRILSSAHVPATFFIVGRNLARFPSAFRAEERIGALGDHTWTHPDLGFLAPTAVMRQIGSTKRAIEGASGRPVRLFRPPYGVRNATVDATARRLGLIEVLWTVDSADSLGANYAQIARNVLGGLRPGSIILMHENRGQTIRALKFSVLPRLRRLHLRLVTVPQLLSGDPPTPAQLARGARGCGASQKRTGA